MGKNNPANKKQNGQGNSTGNDFNAEPVVIEPWSIDKCLNVYISLGRWLQSPFNQKPKQGKPKQGQQRK